jgi:ribosomal protein L29
MKDIREKKNEDLSKLLTEKEGALKDFRFGISGSKTRNVREGRALRKDIARIKTVFSERKNA